MTKLNPCPDCGREPDLEERAKSFRVVCWHCSSDEFIVARSASGAMNAWNAATSEQPAKTLRDEFAMAVISGYMDTNSPLSDNSAAWCAGHAYLVADSMLKERSK